MAYCKPKSPDNEKIKKYDRQLRLWGDHGQTALEGAHICLINATATGTEILKNIILPGIGAFTIIDGNKISGEDVGNNFFLEKESIGKSRAQVATQYLLELNSDVRGDCFEETPEELLEANPTFFNNFSVVIGTSLTEKTLLTLSEKLWEANIPFLVCRSYGMVGYMRLQIAEHTVIESHPDDVLFDLRLDNPFPSLKEHVESYDFENMNKKDYSHIPYIIILLKYLEFWKKEHNDQIPKGYGEKELFREIIKQGMQKFEDLESLDNFEEAIKSVVRDIKVTEIPKNIKDLLQDEACMNLNSESKPFWIMVRAIKEFVDKEGKGLLPLQGAIPDMTADSKRYIELQNIYRNQANYDVKWIADKVQELLSSLGKPQDLISEAEIRLLCKNCRYLRVVRGYPLVQEYNAKTAKVHEITKHLDNPESEMVFYVLLRAIDRFYGEYNRYPGYFTDQVEPDIVKLKGCLNRLLQEWNHGPLGKDDYIHEMCRYGACELHSVAAFVGGCAAQEVIKLVTSQYVPFNNTYIYNAMTATSTVFQL